MTTDFGLSGHICPLDYDHELVVSFAKGPNLL
jgi:hypothetical protein